MSNNQTLKESEFRSIIRRKLIERMLLESATLANKPTDKDKINKIIKRAGKISQNDFPFFDTLLENLSFKKINKIEKDTNHPMKHSFKRSINTNRPILRKCRNLNF